MGEVSHFAIKLSLTVIKLTKPSICEPFPVGPKTPMFQTHNAMTLWCPSLQNKHKIRWIANNFFARFRVENMLLWFLERNEHVKIVQTADMKVSPIYTVLSDTSSHMTIQ